MKIKSNVINLSIVSYPINIFFSCTIKPAITPETALQSYIHNNDESFSWKLKDSYENDDLKIYHLLVTSQKWRWYIWKHKLMVIVPENYYNGRALLFV